MAVTSFEMS